VLIVSFFQDLYGAAEPVSPDENLDVTASKPKVNALVDVAKTPAAKEEKPKTKAPALTSTAEGLSAAQKLFFIGAIIALCALFLRSRGSKNSSGLGGKEKSMA
jgi:peptidyl-prolyl cis-trans isomerase B (cyclophilin B)